MADLNKVAALMALLASQGLIGRGLLKKIPPPNRHCVACGKGVPPGRAGRRCVECREGGREGTEEGQG